MEEAGWIEVRALSHREALERESIGTYEECELGRNGGVLSVVRRFDLWAMAEYDYARAVTDYLLPERELDGRVTMGRMRRSDPEANLSLLAAMPPRLAQWVQDCIDQVNLRSEAGRASLEDAEKKHAS